MRSNSSVFYALMSLSAILGHIVCGSPMPISSDRGSPSSISTSSDGGPAGPSLRLELPIIEAHGSFPSMELKSWATNLAKATLNFYGPDQLRSFIREFDESPGAAINYVISVNPNRAARSMAVTAHREVDYVICLFRFLPDHDGNTVDHDFSGRGHLLLAIEKGPSPRVDPSKSGMSVFIEGFPGLSRNARSHELNIGPVRKRSG
ncbi:hypothetical protein EV361DRAFT_938774 [Lentinula raphanica]|nr:hypothetical protein EV361DRAFT_938774 [Lentinula raphanica]